MKKSTIENFKSFNPMLQQEILTLASESDMGILMRSMQEKPAINKPKPQYAARVNLADIIKDNLTMLQVVEFYLGDSKQSAWVCPFHGDQHPSMTVKGGKFKCWSCNESGDVFDFAGKLHGLDFKGSISLLARDFGYSDKEVSQADKKSIAARKEAHAAEIEQRSIADMLERGKIELLGHIRSILRILNRSICLKWSEVECIVNLQNSIKLLDLELDEIVEGRR